MTAGLPFSMASALGASKVAAATLIAVTCAGCTADHAEPVKVGVLLPLTGDAASGYDEALSFARDEINRAGGVRGRPVELVFQDTGTIPPGALDAPRRTWEMAKLFLADPDIDVVIGADTDEVTFGLVPSFIKTGKVLISPVAAGAELSRAFAHSGFLRRTIASDAARAELMLLLAKRTGAQTVSVLATSSMRSATFFDWIPYHAEQLGLEVNKSVRTGPGDPDCANAVEQVQASGAPDVLFLLADTTTQAECMVRKARELMPESRLFLNEPSRLSGLFAALGPLAEGIVGISSEPTLQRAAGPTFDDAFVAKFGHAPPHFAAHTFDALALAAYGLARAQGGKGAQLVAAFDAVVEAKGEVTAWNGDGMARAFALIEAGDAPPDVTGAAGALSFSAQFPIEATSGTFALWQVRGGVQHWDEIQLGPNTISFPKNYLSSDEHRNPFEEAPAFALRSVVRDEDTGYVPAERQGAWAFIAALSGGMDNYRHQADALNMYQVLKARGFTDDHIVLVLADDLATAATNPQPGTVSETADGRNLRTADVEVDYRLDGLTPGALLNILKGKKTDETPKVIESTANDDVFVYWVGHGGGTGMLVGDSAHVGEAVAGPFVTPWAFASALQEKFDSSGYRQMVVVMDSCHAGVMGQPALPPGTLLITGAAPNENSYATNYSASTNIWHADGFSDAIAARITDAPTSTLVDLYEETYLRVRGSHPRLYNGGRFGHASLVTIGSILTP